MGEITGKHVLAIAVTAFGVIIAVNVVMAWKAVSTFPGLEVANSYVASQEFNEKRAAQAALGWTLAHDYDAGRLRLSFTDAAGVPVEVEGLEVLVGRTTEAKDDLRPAFTWLNGSYEAEALLAPGSWMLRVTARAKDGTAFEQRGEFQVGG